MFLETLNILLRGSSLDEIQSFQVMSDIMSGNIVPAQIAAILTALRIKGETADEITGLAKGMRQYSRKVQLDGITALDTCGTGGDGSNTFNISTAAAFVIAACGQPVAKHGNRAATSRCGSADVLEALGAKIELNPEDVARTVRESGFGFMFAPAYHPSMKYAAPVRKELGFRTVFNILGPLTNPSQTPFQLLGAPKSSLVPIMAEALLRLGVNRALVVYGEDGVDEFSLQAKTQVAEISGAKGTIREYTVDPQEMGLTPAPLSALRGGSAKTNAAIIRGVLSGEITGPQADVIALNAGAALYISGVTKSIKDGVKLAKSHMNPNGALQTMGKFVALSQDLAAARMQSYAV